MGLLDALINSSVRFENEETFKELGIGFDYRPINWVIEFDQESNKLTLKGRYKDDMIRSVPLRGDRSGKVAKNNIKPNLFVDNANYALGVGEESTSNDAFEAFKNLHIDALNELKKSGNDQQELEKELNILIEFFNLTQQARLEKIKEATREISTEKENKNTGKRNKKESKTTELKPNDLVAFAISEKYLFDEPNGFIRTFWKNHLQRECSDQKGICSVCGQEKSLVRILPFKIRLFGERCPILSVNTDEQQSFGSSGKKQLGNSPICMDCAGTADRLLKFLTKLGLDNKGKLSRRFAVILSHDDHQALGNQIAVFWTKEQLQSATEEKREFEALIKLPIEQFDSIEGAELQSRASQCRVLLESPFTGKKNDTELQANQFYLAVLSPNKSRLVVREWLEESIEKTHQNLIQYMDSLQVIHPTNEVVLSPPIPAIWDALQSYSSSKQVTKEKPRIPALGPDAMRKLLRCIYTGTHPPETLLTRALRCFRIPDPPTDSNEHERRNRQMYRRMAMAATMKLILTYNEDIKEQKAMTQLKTKFDSESNYKKKSPYNCGVLLAILEAIQRKASFSGRGVNTTLVDRYYSAASTAPAIIFANLINMATKAHLPKLRRENKEFFNVSYQEEKININDLMNETCKAIDNAGGFPPPLEPKDQAAFALGFYHQRAAFALQPKKKVLTKNNNPKEA